MMKKKKNRIKSYDAFRGLLVMGMIFYHVLLHFYDGKFFEGFFYWVAVGFMLFLGIVIGKFLWNRPQKILPLGLKLMIIFLVFNGPNFLSADKDLTWKMLVFGNQDFFALDILWPMGWVLFFIAAFKKTFNSVKFSNWLILAFSFLGILCFDLTSFYAYNLLFISYGLLGYAIGRLVNLDAFLQRIYQEAWILILALGFLSFFIYWKWGVFHFLAVIQVLLLYFLWAGILKSNKFIVQSGKYSLWIYVCHIILIRIILPFVSGQNFIFSLGIGLGIFLLSFWMVRGLDFLIRHCVALD